MGSGSNEIKASNDELIRAIRELAEQERQASIKQEAYNALHGIGPNGPVLPVNPGTLLSSGQAQGLAGGGGSFWDSGSKSDNAFGSGASVMQKFLSSGGFNGAAGLVGGLAGGISGIGGVAAQVGGAILESSISPFKAQTDTIIESERKASPFQDARFIDQRARLEANVAKVKAEETTVDALSGALGGSSAFDALERSRRIRQAQGRVQEYDSVERNTEDRMRQYFAPVTRFGGRPSRDQIAELFPMMHAQAEAQFAADADIQNVVSRLHAATPGTQSQNQKR